MNRMKRLQGCIQKALAIALCAMVPGASWADITNTASATFRDAANNSYTVTSNTVSIPTPPVITSATSATGDVGVAFSYQITATNSPTGYSATGLPSGLSVNATSGLVSGTPTAAGTFNVALGAINSAGTGNATWVLTIRGGSNIVLTKSASASNAKKGDTVTFTIAYQNTGSGSASSVVITDAIPAGSTLVAGSITGGGTVSAGTITWTIGTVAAGASGSVSFQVTVN